MSKEELEYYEDKVYNLEWRLELSECKKALEEIRGLTRNAVSLIQGIKELREEWSTLGIPEGRLSSLVGFLFAALPVEEVSS